MLMFGKMSVGVRSADAVPKIRISTAMTTNVYGRRKASRTIPIIPFSHVKRNVVAGAADPWGCLNQCSQRQLFRLSSTDPTHNPESRVEFRIRKMHSLHPHMFILNYGLEYQSLDQDGSQAGCDRPEPAGGVRRHHA